MEKDEKVGGERGRDTKREKVEGGERYIQEKEGERDTKREGGWGERKRYKR